MTGSLHLKSSIFSKRRWKFSPGGRGGGPSEIYCPGDVRYIAFEDSHSFKEKMEIQQWKRESSKGTIEGNIEGHQRREPAKGTSEGNQRREPATGTIEGNNRRERGCSAWEPPYCSGRQDIDDGDDQDDGDQVGHPGGCSLSPHSWHAAHVRFASGTQPRISCSVIQRRSFITRETTTGKS